MKRLFLPFMMLCLLLFAGKAEALASAKNGHFHISPSGWVVWNATTNTNQSKSLADCEIDAFYIEGFETPAVGVTVGDIELGTSAENYSVLSVEWFDNDDLTMTALADDYEFEAGHSYYMTLNVQLNNECTPAGEYTVYLDEDASLIDPTYNDFYEGVLYTYSINFEVEEPSPSEEVTITNDFENGMEGWTMNNCHGSTGISSGYTAHGGSSMFRFYYTPNYPQYLISPLLDPNDGGNFSFYYARYSGSYPETFKVGYSTTTNDPTAFTWGDEETSTNAYNVEFLLYSYDFPAGTKYVAIACTSNDQFYLFIDDITITYIPAPANPCIAPSNFDYALNGAELTLTWNASTMDAPAYTVYRSTDGVSYEPIAFTEDTTYTCALLEEGTYYYQVTASASGMTCESDPALTPDGADHIMVEYVIPVCMAPINLAADVDDNNVILTWEMPDATFNFEDGLQGWTTFQGANADAGTSWVHSDNEPAGYDYTGLGHDGSNGFALSYSYDDGTYASYHTDNYLVSPEKCLVDENTQMTFFYDYGADNYPDNFTVEVSTASNDNADDFTAIWTVGSKGGNNNHAKVRRSEATRYENWREVTIDLSDYAGQEIWVAFHHADYDNYEVWIDDVTINGIMASADSYNVYRAVGNGSYELLENVEDMTYTDEGLDNGTYRYQVTAIHELIGGSCESDPAMDVDSVNNYVEAVVDVTPACTAPSNFAYTLNGAELTLTWNASTMDDPAYIVYRSTDGENYEPIDFTEDTTYTCALLEEGTYYYQVTASGMTCESDPALTPDGADYIMVEYTIPVVTCAAPIDLAAEVEDNNVILTWGMNGAVEEPIFEDDFEDGALANWALIDADGDGFSWENATPYDYGIGDAHSGTNCASSWSWNNATMYPDNYMISPLVEGATRIQYYVATNTAYPDHYGVLVSTTGTDAADFTEVFDETPGSKGAQGGNRSSMTKAGDRAMSAWMERNVDLPAGTKYVAFRHYNSDDMNYIFIDDVTIYGINAPEGVTYNVYRAVGNGSYELYAENVEDMTYTDEDLDNGIYRYQVTAVHALLGGACESDPAMDVDNENDYVEAVVDFTYTCEVPTNFASSLEGNELTLTWNAVSDPNAVYAVYATIDGVEQEADIIEETSTYYTLSIGSTYYFQVTAMMTLPDQTFCESDPALTADGDDYIEIVFDPVISCEAPINLDIDTDGNNNITLTWEMPEPVGPTTYDFEDGLQGWTTFQGADADDGTSWLHSNDNPGGHDYTGLGHDESNGFAMSYSFVDYVAAYQADNYMVSPEKYTIEEGTQLTFFYDYGNDQYPDYFTVEVSTASNDNADDFTAIWAVGSKGGNNNHAKVRKAEATRYDNWREVNIDLSAYAGQEVWIAFHHTDYDNYEVWIDDVTLGVADNSIAGNLTFNVYRAVGNGSYELIAEDVEGMTYTDEGLADGTYRYQVTAVNTLFGGSCESYPAMAIDGVNDYVEIAVDGINDFSNLIKLYPNPTKSNVTIEADNMSRIVIVNTLGQVVYDANMSSNNTVINMSNFGAGLYMVNITTDNGVIVKRVTVAK